MYGLTILVLGLLFPDGTNLNRLSILVLAQEGDDLGRLLLVPLSLSPFLPAR
jgi:hypothetical protein